MGTMEEFLLVLCGVEPKVVCGGHKNAPFRVGLDTAELHEISTCCALNSVATF